MRGTTLVFCVHIRDQQVTFQEKPGKPERKHRARTSQAGRALAAFQSCCTGLLLCFINESINIIWVIDMNVSARESSSATAQLKLAEEGSGTKVSCVQTVFLAMSNWFISSIPSAYFSHSMGVSNQKLTIVSRELQGISLDSYHWDTYMFSDWKDYTLHHSRTVRSRRKETIPSCQTPS